MDSEHIEARLKEVPPHPFSTSGELFEKNPRPGILHEDAGPPSFGASSAGPFHFCKADCNAEMQG